jgi:hypothetical protein
VVTVPAGSGGDVGCIFGHFFENASLIHPRCGWFQIVCCIVWCDVWGVDELVRLGMQEAPEHARHLCPRASM